VSRARKRGGGRTRTESPSSPPYWRSARAPVRPRSAANGSPGRQTSPALPLRRLRDRPTADIGEPPSQSARRSGRWEERETGEVRRGRIAVRQRPSPTFLGSRTENRARGRRIARAPRASSDPGFRPLAVPAAVRMRVWTQSSSSPEARRSGRDRGHGLEAQPGGQRCSAEEPPTQDRPTGEAPRPVVARGMGPRASPSRILQPDEASSAAIQLMGPGPIEIRS